MINPKNWYKNCGDAIRKEFGLDADLFIDLLASTSPRKQVSANWRLAMRIYHVWKNDPLAISRYDNLMTGTLPAHRKNIMRALRREPLSGNKVRAFAANLKGDLSQVTIDIWVQRWYCLVGTLTNNVYVGLAAQIRAEAAANNMKPAEWQAIIWCKAIEATGRKPKSFLSVPDKGQQYFEFYWQGD